MSSSLEYLSIRKTIVNHLRNGDFMSLPRQFTLINNWGASGGVKTGESRVLKTLYRYEVTDQSGEQSSMVAKDIPGCYVQSAPPAENYFAYWDVWGVEGLIGVNSLGASLDGGHRLDVTFASKGSITLRQAMTPFDKFRGKPVTLAVSGYHVKGDVKVTLKIDTGAVLESRPFYSRYFGKYSRMVHAFDLPTSITKFEVSIVMEGLKGSVMALSGAMLALGAYTSDLPFSETPLETTIPSGTVILWTGASCPPGYRAIADDTYLYAHQGDPNAFRGDLTDPDFTRETTLGQNYHDHAAGSNERQPSAFDVRGDSFVSPAVLGEGAPRNYVRLGGYPTEEESEYYEGVREKTLPMGHTHLIKIAEAPVEPPRIKVRICERI
jgi:hypothetical protein